ncbi:MAG TPA: type II secretion system F family protein [Candidatus Hydrogenedentes bacterium]|jgi:type IV pilus assembly protein PilC|nr:MAG: Type II secretion system protein F [Candidatus Hydrogenedentes bacterium ADurb.Bin170]HNZ47903.1 type II secretion system F family protein [Candidatus Hydrogenedentota bacterium]HOD94973.1 type II secretion system F family protein [Candidatus Hydrogenedentota bacterium]HOR49716.1 type II secretion system F family protein [Candidatus Hydrogenedentota bacterium]HPK23854.1 type II secretion system F family protein [Candidatus Hydrogenedentota bacterium]
MPRYEYEVKKGPGEVVNGVLEAENKRAAVARLREMGYFPIRVDEQVEEESKDTLREAMKRIRVKDRNIFLRQLANLSESGMMITRALRTLVDQTENPKLARIVDRIRDDVQKGASLADAMEKHPQVFPSMYCSLIRAGETGGMLEEVLWRICAFGEQEEELRGKAVSAMIYPTFLLIVGSAAIFILISFVFPKFITIFEDFNAQLPLPTVIVMKICDFMGTWWWAVLLGIVGTVVLLIRYYRTEPGKRKFDGWALKIPAVNTLIIKYEMAKFSRTLGTLLDNGVPVLTSLKITADTMSNLLVRDRVAELHNGVTEGESLSETMREGPLFPPMVVSMFAVGEESGRIGDVARRIADAYDLEVDRAVKALTALFEPLLIVIMGVVIGFLVIAMLLPMLTLSSNIGA